jgi:YggT family protein
MPGVLATVSVFHILAGVVEAYVVVLIIRALLSWFPVRSSGFASVLRVLDMVTEPVLRPIRRILPPVRMGGMAMDLSIIVVILVAQLVLLPLLNR